MITKAMIDPAELTAVVRAAEDDQFFEVLDWDVQTLSTGGAVSDGLLRVSGRGHGAAGSRPWSVALKLIKEVEARPNERNYWQRERNAYGSGLLASLPGPVRAARCYGASEHGDTVWIWMELLTDRSGRAWDLADYVFAADQVARFNATCAQHPPVMDAPWLAKDHARYWHSIMNFEEAWRNAQVRQVFAPHLQRRLERLWQKREHLYAVLDQLPQVFGHYDYKSRNLFIRQHPNNRREVIAGDWGDCGIGALGGDLAMLVSSSTFFLDWPPERVAELDAAAYDSYLHGLLDAGWRGRVEHVRLSYLVWSALYFGSPLAACVEFGLQEGNRDFVLRLMGCYPELWAQSVLALCDFTLNCADEAYGLIAQLDL
jgi:hypothetical protein